MTSPISRRQILTSALAAGLAGAGGRALAAEPMPDSSIAPIAFSAPQPFSFEGLKVRAAQLAMSPYAPAPIADAALLDTVDYDASNAVTYKPALTLWGDAAGAQAVRLFPLGKFSKEPVAISVVEAGQARQVTYSPDLFDMPADHPLRRLTVGGFAGFRCMNAGGIGDWMAFLGASYFRSAGPFDQYGASARGLAINSGGPAREEFPRFSAFWLEQDGTGGLITYALMEGPSVTGAFRIDSQRTADGPMQEIEASLYFRAPVETLGVAPLTSMFWYGENNPEDRTDWRPEVHDSDGLAVWNGAGERLWRPLTSPARVTTNAFLDTDPKGFGLIQRDRSFENYQDDGVFYEKRPSLWVEPLSGWGPGAVSLVELPTDSETNDNIVAFWTPRQKVRAGDALDFRYRLHWRGDAPMDGAGEGRVIATRMGAGGRPGFAQTAARKIVIDLEGEALKGLTRDSGVKGMVSASGGQVSDVFAYPVVGTDRWRLMFDLMGGRSPIDLRASLRLGDRTLSETWLYQL